MCYENDFEDDIIMPKVDKIRKRVYLGYKLE